MNKISFITFAILATASLNAVATTATNIVNLTKHERPAPEEVMKKLDANKDGKISKEESKGPVKKDFERIDTNKDGYIVIEEIKSAPMPPSRKGPNK